MCIRDRDNDVTLADLAALCDVFYLGGTKMGALFGEALVIPRMQLQTDFRYHIKQNGGMLAKGWLLGVQFLTLLEGNRYLAQTSKAVEQALAIKRACLDKGYPLYIDSPTNQQFVILPPAHLRQLEKEFVFTRFGETQQGQPIIRMCTSWATREEAVRALIAKIAALPALS